MHVIFCLNLNILSSWSTFLMKHLIYVDDWVLFATITIRNCKYIHHNLEGNIINQEIYIVNNITTAQLKFEKIYFTFVMLHVKIHLLWAGYATFFKQMNQLLYSSRQVLQLKLKDIFDMCLAWHCYVYLALSHLMEYALQPKRLSFILTSQAILNTIHTELLACLIFTTKLYCSYPPCTRAHFPFL